MIEVIRQRFTESMPAGEKLNRAREFLQILCLKILNEKGYFDHLAFVGGTALRVLFDLKRFSEDLDFSIHRKQGFETQKMSAELGRMFGLHGLPFEAKVKAEGNVQGVMMKFTGLLKELGLSAFAEQKLSIRVEIDLNPPQGWNLLSTVIHKDYLFSLTHYDLPSLFAGKLHACFFRRFVKGRDFYDFVWYLGKKVKPNFTFLNNAILQTEKKDPEIGEKNFVEFLTNGIEKIDFTAVRKDVERFLEDKSELAALNKKSICDTIQSIYGAGGT